MESDRPYEVILTGLAEANVAGLPQEIGTVCHRVFRILQDKPHAFCRESNEPGGHKYKFGINLDDSAIAFIVSLDEAERKVTVLEVIHPALIVAID